MITRAIAEVLTFLAVVVCCFAASSAKSQDDLRLQLEGMVCAEPIDDQRVIIAIDTNGKGNADHLFLYTASEPLRVSPSLRNVPARVEYRRGEFLLLTMHGLPYQPLKFLEYGNVRDEAAEGSAIRFDKTIGLSHYIPTVPMKIMDLASWKKVADCNAAPKACLEVAGQFVPFPG